VEVAQEGVDGHVGERGASAGWRLEVDAHAAVVEGLDGIVGEGRAEQVAAEAFESLAVSRRVDGGASRPLAGRGERCRTPSVGRA